MNACERVIANVEEANKGPLCVDDAHRDWNEIKIRQKTKKTGKSTGVREYAHRVRKLRKKGPPRPHLIVQCCFTPLLPQLETRLSMMHSM